LRRLLDTSGGRIVSVAFIAIALFIAGVLATTDSSKVPFIVAIGVVGSLIASFIALLVNVLVVGDTAGRVTTAVTTLDAGIDQLRTASEILAQTQANGIRAVKPKGEYELPEWRALLTGAHQRFFVVGHALDKWCKQELRATFAETLDRLARDGGDIFLVTLPLDGSAHQDPHRGVDYERRIETTMRLLAEIHARLPADRRRHLNVRTLRQGVPMPYTVAGNERVLITSSYPGTEQQSGTMLALTIDANADAGRRIYNDIMGLFHDLTDPVDLERFRAGPS
jgi:hypothetical protein